jgi:predicted RNA binding protein YcfA (HicA-like mRNA interferase family)
MKRIYKVSEVIRILELHDWYMVKRTGTSHRKFRHPVNKGAVTVNGKLSEDLDQWMLKSISRQSGIKF